MEREISLKIIKLHLLFERNMQKRLFLLIILSAVTLISLSQSRTLDYYLNKGLSNSPLLNDYRNQQLSARSDSLLVKASRKPSIEVNTQLQYSPFGKNSGYDEVITDGGNYTAVMGIRQNFLNSKEINNKYESAAIQRQSVINSSKIYTTELRKLITDQYLTAYLGLTDLNFNRDFLSLLKKENDIVEKLVSNGAGKQTDYLALLIETQSQQILLKQLESDYRKDISLLNEICGISDSVMYDLAGPVLERNGSDDINRSPSFLQFKIDSLKLGNEKNSIDIRYKPKVSWFADAGMMTSNPWTFYRHFGFSAGLSLNVPVYDGRQRELEKNKILFQENSRKAYENNFRVKYYLQIRQLEDELSSLNSISTDLEKQIKTTDLLAGTLKSQLEAGIALMTDYINAVKNLRSARRELNLVNLKKLQIINEINYLLTP
jgi:outer membrane protein TolC